LPQPLKLLQVEKLFHDLLDCARSKAEGLDGIATIEFFASETLRPLPERELLLGEQILELIAFENALCGSGLPQENIEQV
jgi:hypothetical protein